MKTNLLVTTSSTIALIVVIGMSENLKAETPSPFVGMPHPMRASAAGDLSPTELQVLEDLYFLAPQSLLWIDEKHPYRVEQALELLSKAEENGLVADDYAVDVLQQTWRRISQGEQAKASELTEFDMALSQSVVRFLSDLGWGRENAEGAASIGFKRDIDIEKVATAILEAVHNDQILAMIGKIEPNLILYKDLKAALLKFRELAKDQQLPPIQLNKSLRKGDIDPQVVKIKQKLFSLGMIDTAFADQLQSKQYQGAWFEGVKRFQRLHGLLDDGILGKNTLAALNTPVSQRVQQIILAMERIRWWPKQLSDANPVILVNIPAYKLWVFSQGLAQNTHSLSMKVIVGQAEKNQTPIFLGDLSYLVFHPYWNVPKKIATKEIIPQLLANPLYLTEQNMETVQLLGERSTSQSLDEQSIELLKRGKMRIRQKPGLKNSLGKIKFIFPNKHAVYLHDTPAKSLFRKERRDFSHGCVRLEKPQELAEFVLQSQQGWSVEKIDNILKQTRNQWVNVKKPIAVLISYNTAQIIDDEIYFYQDIYGYDQKLTQALSKIPLKQPNILVSHN